MAWTAIASTDVDVDSPLDTDLFTALRDRDEALRQAVVPVYITEQTTAIATYLTLFSFALIIPDFPNISGYTRQLVFELSVKVDAGTGTYKITDNAAAVDSNEATSTSGSYEQKTLTLNFADGLQGTTRTIDVKAKNSATNTTYLQNIDRITSYLKY